MSGLNFTAQNIGDVGTASAGAATTLTDSSKAWGTAGSGVFANGTITILKGTGAGQTRTISSNTGTVITVSSAWTTNPDATSVYYIEVSGTIATVAASTKTVLLIQAGANSRLKNLGWGVSLDTPGTNSQPSIVQLCHFTNAGTPGNATVVAACAFSRADLSYAELMFARGQLVPTTGVNWTTEPQVQQILDSKEVLPGNTYEKYWPYDLEKKIAGSGFFGIRVITPAGQTPNVAPFLDLDE